MLENGTAESLIEGGNVNPSTKNKTPMTFKEVEIPKTTENTEITIENNVENKNSRAMGENTISVSLDENEAARTLGLNGSSSTSTMEDTGPLVNSRRRFRVVARLWEENRVIWICFILVFKAALLVLYLMNKNGMVEDQGADKFCTTEGFIGKAYDIQKSKNCLVNPCNNFYEYTCGNYEREIGQIEDSPFEENFRKYHETIEEILNMTSTEEDHPVLKYAREVYHGCLESTGSTPNDPSAVGTLIKKRLKIRSWPITQRIALYKDYISGRIAELILQDQLKPIFDVNIFYPPAWTGETFIFEISEPILNLPFELQGSPISSRTLEFQNFVTIVVDLIYKFGEEISTISNCELRELSTDIIQFEQGLFDITNPQKNKDSYEIISATKLDELTGNASDTEDLNYISVRKTLVNLLEEAGRPHLKDDDKVRIFNSTVFSTLLSYISSARPETLVNYLGYRIANAYYSDSSDTNTGSSRVDCLTSVQERFLPALLSHPHLKINRDIINDIRGIFSNVKNELILTQLRNNDLNATQRARILDGIQKIQLCPDRFILNYTELDEYYSGLLPLKESYVDLASKLNRWNKAKEFSVHGMVQPDNCELLEGLPVPSMDQQFLQMFIPPNAWMEPYYNFEWPAYLKYSGIGFTIGHELMHALYFINPDLGNTRQCIIDHYEGFSNATARNTFGRWSYGHPEINGTLTLQEDYADIGGIQLAYAAYKSEIVKIATTDSPLLTNYYSDDQLFFHNYVRGWCNLLSPIDESEDISEYVHSLDIFRTLGALRNNEDFVEVWKCQNETYMNPLNKCAIF